MHADTGGVLPGHGDAGEVGRNSDGGLGANGLTHGHVEGRAVAGAVQQAELDFSPHVPGHRAAGAHRGHHNVLAHAPAGRHRLVGALHALQYGLAVDRADGVRPGNEVAATGHAGHGGVANRQAGGALGDGQFAGDGEAQRVEFLGADGGAAVLALMPDHDEAAIGQGRGARLAADGSGGGIGERFQAPAARCHVAIPRGTRRFGAGPGSMATEA